MQVRITANAIGPEELKSTLEQAAGGSGDVTFQYEARDNRAIDPTVLVALIGAGSTILSSLVGGLVGMARDRKAAKIIIQTDNGRIEAPANLPPEQVERLVERVRQLGTEQVNIHLA